MDTRRITAEEATIILGLEEGHFRDLKAREIAPAKLSQSISAFANTAGGEIFLGIAESKDNNVKKTEWVGYSDPEAANPVLAMLEGLGGIDFITPSLLICEEKSGYVLHLIIQKTRHIVHSTDGRAYVRRGAHKLPVISTDALRRLELDKGLVTYEDHTVAVDIEAVTNSVTVLDFIISEVPTAEPDRWLKSQFLLTGGKPTVAAALLFADEPQAIPPKRSAIKIFRYKTLEDGLELLPLRLGHRHRSLLQRGSFGTHRV